MSKRFLNKEGLLKVNPILIEIPPKLLSKTMFLAQIALHLVQEPKSLNPVIIRNFLRNLSNVRSIFKNLIKISPQSQESPNEALSKVKEREEAPFIKYLNEMNHQGTIYPGKPRKHEHKANRAEPTLEASKEINPYESQGFSQSNEAPLQFPAQEPSKDTKIPANAPQKIQFFPQMLESKIEAPLQANQETNLQQTSNLQQPSRSQAQEGGPKEQEEKKREVSENPLPMIEEIKEDDSQPTIKGPTSPKQESHLQLETNLQQSPNLQQPSNPQDQVTSPYIQAFQMQTLPHQIIRKETMVKGTPKEREKRQVSKNSLPTIKEINEDESQPIMEVSTPSKQEPHLLGTLKPQQTANSHTVNQLLDDKRLQDVDRQIQEALKELEGLKATKEEVELIKAYKLEQNSNTQAQASSPHLQANPMRMAHQMQTSPHHQMTNPQTQSNGLSTSMEPIISMTNKPSVHQDALVLPKPKCGYFQNLVQFATTQIQSAPQGSMHDPHSKAKFSSIIEENDHAIKTKKKIPDNEQESKITKKRDLKEEESTSKNKGTWGSIKEEKIEEEKGGGKEEGARANQDQKSSKQNGELQLQQTSNIQAQKALYHLQASPMGMALQMQTLPHQQVQGPQENDVLQDTKPSVHQDAHVFPKPKCGSFQNLIPFGISQLQVPLQNDMKDPHCKAKFTGIIIEEDNLAMKTKKKIPGNEQESKTTKKRDIKELESASKTRGSIKEEKIDEEKGGRNKEGAGAALMKTLNDCVNSKPNSYEQTDFRESPEKWICGMCYNRCDEMQAIGFKTREELKIHLIEAHEHQGPIIKNLMETFKEEEIPSEQEQIYVWGDYFRSLPSSSDSSDYEHGSDESSEDQGLDDSNSLQSKEEIPSIWHCIICLNEKDHCKGYNDPKSLERHVMSEHQQQILTRGMKKKVQNIMNDLKQLGLQLLLDEQIQFWEDHGFEWRSTERATTREQQSQKENGEIRE